MSTFTSRKKIIRLHLFFKPRRISSETIVPIDTCCPPAKTGLHRCNPGMHLNYKVLIPSFMACALCSAAVEDRYANDEAEVVPAAVIIDLVNVYLVCKQ